jgi:hypothetical protein
VAAINCRVYASRGFAHNASASPVSTSFPCYITAIRVLKYRTSGMECEMNR